jgi:hypothetical protein
MAASFGLDRLDDARRARLAVWVSTVFRRVRHKILKYCENWLGLGPPRWSRAHKIIKVVAHGSPAAR